MYACLPPPLAFMQMTDILFLWAVVLILGFDGSLLGLTGAVVRSAFEVELFGKFVLLKLFDIAENIFSFVMSLVFLMNFLSQHF